MSRALPSRPDVSVADALHALDAILVGSQLRHCPRLASFLRFIVTTTLDGRADRIKGYTIGVEALGRDASFDPQADPIVRVEALRLRRALARYYASEGLRDPVIIELPRGRYVPRFRRRPRAMPRLIWHGARRVLHGLLAARGAALLPPPQHFNPRPDDGRQVQQAESAPTARARRSRRGRACGDAAHDRGDPRGL